MKKTKTSAAGHHSQTAYIAAETHLDVISATTQTTVRSFSSKDGVHDENDGKLQKSLMSVQNRVLSFFHSFQQESTAMTDQRLQSMASKLDKDMDMFLLDTAMASQCNLEISFSSEDSTQSTQDGDDFHSITANDSFPKHDDDFHKKDFVSTIRHVLFSTLTFAAGSFVAELKGQYDLSPFLYSPPVRILKLLSIYFFRHTSTYCTAQDCSQIFLELFDKFSSKALTDDLRAILCWWFGTCMSQMNSNSALFLEDNNLYFQLLERMNNLLLNRVLDDKSQKVRYAAIIASCVTLEKRMNHPVSFDTQQVLNCLLFAMANDSSCQNRCAVLSNIPVYEDTMSSIIKRIRDVHPKVRVDALYVLQTKTDVLQLSTQQRVDILKFGLTPRCMNTYEATVILLCCSWLKSMKFDTIALIRLLDPVVNEPLCETLIQTILTVAFNTTLVSTDSPHNIKSSSSTLILTPAMEDKLKNIQQNLQNVLSEHEIQFWKNQISRMTVNLSSSRGTVVQEGELTSLDSASSLYVRCFTQWVLRIKEWPDLQKWNQLSNILPDVPAIGKILLDSSQKIQLLMDEDNTENFFDNDAYERDLLFTCRQLFKLFRFIDLKEEGSRRHFLSIIKEILCSVDTHIDIVASCLEAMKILYVSDADFLNAIEKILSDINRKYPDSMQEMKDVHSLDILSSSLNQCSRTVIQSTILESFSKLILSTITSNEPDVREAAVECLGRLTLLLDESKVLEEYKPLLLEISRNIHETDEIRAQALMALCDLSILFPSILDPVQQNDSQFYSYVQLLETLLTTCKSPLLYVAAECILKLHFVDRVHDSNLLGHLILLYFGHDSMTDHDLSIGSPIRLHQLLTLFFPAYGMKSTIGRDTLVHSATDIRRLVQEQVHTKVKGRKSKQWPLGKIIDFIETCTSEKDDLVQQDG